MLISISEVSPSLKLIKKRLKICVKTKRSIKSSSASWNVVHKYNSATWTINFATNRKKNTQIKRVEAKVRWIQVLQTQGLSNRMLG